MAVTAILGAIASKVGGDLLKEGVGWLGHYVKNEINLHHAPKFAAISNAFALQFEKDKYKAQAEGMRAAGLNPAVTSAFSMGWTARN